MPNRASLMHRTVRLVSALCLSVLLAGVAVAQDSETPLEIIESLEQIGFTNQEIATEINKQFGKLDDDTIDSLEKAGVDPELIDLLRGTSKPGKRDADPDDSDKDPDQSFSYVDDLFETIENLTRLGFNDEEIYQRIYEDQRLPTSDEIDELEDRGVSNRLLSLLRRGAAPSRPKPSSTERPSDNDNGPDLDERDEEQPRTRPSNSRRVTIDSLRRRLANGETLEEIIISIVEDGYDIIIDAETLAELQEDGRLLEVLIPLIDPNADTSNTDYSDNSFEKGGSRRTPGERLDSDEGDGFLAGSGRRAGSSALDVESFGAGSADVGLLLAQAKSAFDNLRLTTPKGDSAFDYYNQVLAIDPGNPDARVGISQIVDRYIQLAQGAAAKGQRRTAKRYLASARRVSPADTARINQAQNAMLPTFDPDQLKSIREAKQAYLHGKLTKVAYQGVVGRLKQAYRLKVNNLKLQLERGSITRIEYKQKVRAEKIKLEG